MSRALVLVLLCGCEIPPLALIYRVSDGPTQSCPGSSCEDVTIACDSVLNIRVHRPTDPMHPFINVCEGVNPDRDRTLCAIDTVDLPRTRLPAETLEVQVMLWPRSAVEDADSGALGCDPVVFSHVDNFPLDQALAPALGGRAYFEPGDEKTEVMLGCTDWLSVNAESCVGVKRVKITATVSDFDTRLSVQESDGNRLGVDVGEPSEKDGEFVMAPGDVSPLPRTVAGPDPVGGGEAEQEFQASACVQVLEDVPEATSSIACRDAEPTSESLDLSGYRMSKMTLRQVLISLSLPAVPDEGMTVGIVVDFQNNPVAGQVVTPDNGNVKYLNLNRNGTVPGMTSASGIFVSQDAPYRTRFATAIPGQSVVGLGGRVAGKLTIVVLQLPE
ncbi:MAG: hypothetical protein WKG01_35810 [Kofleriaceae bacterium]